jgi:hypothetical protein
MWCIKDESRPQWLEALAAPKINQEGESAPQDERNAIVLQHRRCAGRAHSKNGWLQVLLPR